MRAIFLALVPLLAAIAQTPESEPAAKPAPKQQTARPPSGSRVTAETIQQMKYPPLRPVQIPKVDVSTLPNGMKLYLLEDHELPLVNGTALVRTGNLFDPPDKIGLATTTGMALRTGGTKEKTGDQIDEELENIAASVEGGIGETNGSLRFSALKENTDAVLLIFRDLLTTPEFRQDKVDLAKTQLRSSISRRNDDAHGISRREFADILYGRNNPYGWSMEYTHVDNIDRADLMAFYQRYFFPANIMLAIRGDFSTADMKAKIEHLFSTWNAKQPPVPPFPKVEAKPAPGVFVAAKGDVTQTFFAVGHMGGMLNDKDYPALEVMSDILGGGFQSRLFKKVRTELGYAYSVGANWGADYDHPGLFTISGSTKGMSTLETIKAVDGEIEKIRSAEVTEAELKLAKDTALNSFVFAFDTKAKTLARLITYEYYGYPKDFIDQYQKALAAVTRADVLRVAKQYLKPAELTVVAVGTPGDLQALTGLGAPITAIDLKIPEPKAVVAPVTAETQSSGRELLARAQKAVGGAEKLAAVKDLTQTADYAAEATSGGIKAKQISSWLAPDSYRQQSQLPFGTVVAYYNGKMGVLIQGQQNRVPLAGPQLKQLLGESFRAWVPLLLSDRDPERTINYVGENTVEISDKKGNMARLQVDESGLPQKVTYQLPGMQGRPMSVENSFSDFKEVDGIKLPFKITILQEGKKSAEVTVQDYKLNKGLKPDDIEKRP
jgi:zinc protease